VNALTAAREKVLEPGQSFKECTDCPAMIVVPAGSFMMGSPTDDEEQPRHKVTIAQPFAVARFELTFAEWDACVADHGCSGYIPLDQRQRPSLETSKRPVINVSWDDAKQYVAWLSDITGKRYRLLSEAEYEYATRARTVTVYPWGDTVELNGRAMANCHGCGGKWDGQDTAPVGSFPPNNFDLYDMVGNVYEWTEDCYHDNYKGAPTDGSAWIASDGGDCSLHILRGGCWVSDPDRIDSANRFWNGVDVRANLFGFRVARTLLTP
jgi:formylglycine-generating enzyme required for sulfatase activity